MASAEGSSSTVFITNRAIDDDRQHLLDQYEQGGVTVHQLECIDLAHPPSNSAEARDARVKAALEHRAAVAWIIDAQELSTQGVINVVRSARALEKPAILVADQARVPDNLAGRWHRILGVQVTRPDHFGLAHNSGS